MMKGNIKRLIPSVERELRDAEVRRQRRQAEEALDDSEARKAAIFDSALDSIITIDHAGIIVEFNPEAEKTFGYNRHEVVGKPMAELVIPPGLRENHHRAFARYLATGKASMVGRRIEVTAMRSDGTEFPVELSLTSISTKARPMITAYIRDLTEQKEQEIIRERGRDGRTESAHSRSQPPEERILAIVSRAAHAAHAALVRGSLIDGKAGRRIRAKGTSRLLQRRHSLQLINACSISPDRAKEELNPKRFHEKDRDESLRS